MRISNQQLEATPKTIRSGNELLRRWIRDERGMAMIEQALFLALIAGGAFFTLDSVGLATQNSLAQLNTASQQTAEAEMAINDKIKLPLLGSDLTAEIASAERSIYYLRLTAVGGILVFGVGIWYLLYRKATKEGKASPPTALDNLEVDTDLFSTNVFSKRQEMLRTLLAEPSSILKNQLTVRQLMSTRLAKVSTTATKSKIKHTMATAGTRHLLVCDEAERLIGIISNRDLARQGTVASQIMTADPFTLKVDSPLIPTITLFLKHCISCLPVTEDGRLVGVLTTTDLIMAFQCTFQIMERTGITIGKHPAPEEETSASLVS